MAGSERGLPALVRNLHRRTSSLLLFFVAPFVAEYLLGDLPLKLLPALLVLAPMYGGGALLIREIARRTHRGWPTMLLLGAAYALIEEGLVTQSLFNPDYLFLHGHFLQPAHLAWLETGAWWTLLMLNVHTFWSIGVSIGLVEALNPEMAGTPWLALSGDAVVAAIFTLGVAANAIIGWKQNHFVASTVQFAAAAAGSLLFVGMAFGLRGPIQTALAKRVLSPWFCGSATMLSGLSVQMVPGRWGWGAVGAMTGVDAVFLIGLLIAVRESHWTPQQTLGVATGGALAYGFHAFFQAPVTGGSPAAALASHFVFLALAVWLVAVGARRTARAVSQNGTVIG